MSEQNSYTLEQRKEIMTAVFELMKEGNPFRRACRIVNISPHTATGWMNYAAKRQDEEHEWLSSQFSEARTQMGDAIAEEIIDIADTPEMRTRTKTKTSVNGVETEEWTEDNVAHRKLRVDSRKWLLEKMFPKRWGNQLQLVGDVENPVHVNKIVRKIVEVSKDKS